MMYSIRVVCTSDSSLGKTSLRVNDSQTQVTETKTFYFNEKTDVELVCSPISSEYELVEVINSNNFSINQSSAHHYISVDGEVEVTPIFRKKPKATIVDIGYLRINMNEGGVVNLKGDAQEFSQSKHGTITYPISKKSVLNLEVKPTDGYEVTYIKSNYEKYQKTGVVVFDEENAWIEIRFELSSNMNTTLTQEDLSDIEIKDHIKDHTDEEYNVEDVVKTFSKSSSGYSICVNIDSSLGKTSLRVNDSQTQVTETKTFYFNEKTDVELVCSPISSEYELVEVINSNNFSINQSSAHHYISVDGEVEVTPIFRKKPKATIVDIGYLRINMNEGGVVNLKGDAQEFSQSKHGTITYPISKKSVLNLEVKPTDGYEVRT